MQNRWVLISQSKALIALLFLILLSGCAPKSEEEEEEEDDVVTASSSTSSTSWRNSNLPLTLKTATAFSAAERTVAGDMMTQWDAADSRDYYASVSTTSNKTYSNLNDYADGEFGIYKITDWNSSLPGSALAITQIFGEVIGSQIIITHADILVNYDNFSFDTSTGGAGYDLSTVLLHEMGHFLGLGHQSLSISDSIMTSAITADNEQLTLLSVDISSIQSLYNIAPSLTAEDKFDSVYSDSGEKLKTGTRVRIHHQLNADYSCSVKIIK
ncbi:matrixin family metalloprotease [Bacteriovoracaceae bacterium]|nr:matrixin family metalloprotease [Bacteriovoracaceae bacterium]